MKRIGARLSLYLSTFFSSTTVLDNDIRQTGRDKTHLWPAVSTKYNTASPANGAVNACEDDPAEIGSWVMVSPVAGQDAGKRFVMG